MSEISLQFVQSLKYQSRNRGGKLVIAVNGRKSHLIFFHVQKLLMMWTVPGLKS